MEAWLKTRRRTTKLAIKKKLEAILFGVSFLKKYNPSKRAGFDCLS